MYSLPRHPNATLSPPLAMGVAGVKRSVSELIAWHSCEKGLEPSQQLSHRWSEVATHALSHAANFFTARR